MDVQKMKIDTGDGDWEFFHREDRDGNGWRDLVLIPPQPNQTRKRYRFGWNGERLSICHDSKLLYERHPRLFWVLLKLCREIWPMDARA